VHLYSYVFLSNYNFNDTRLNSKNTKSKIGILGAFFVAAFSGFVALGSAVPVTDHSTGFFAVNNGVEGGTWPPAIAVAGVRFLGAETGLTLLFFLDVVVLTLAVGIVHFVAQMHLIATRLSGRNPHVRRYIVFIVLEILSSFILYVPTSLSAVSVSEPVYGSDSIASWLCKISMCIDGYTVKCLLVTLVHVALFRYWFCLTETETVFGEQHGSGKCTCCFYHQDYQEVSDLKTQSQHQHLSNKNMHSGHVDEEFDISTAVATPPVLDIT
jgi:hypothetical protein